MLNLIHKFKKLVHKFSPQVVKCCYPQLFDVSNQMELSQNDDQDSLDQHSVM